MVSGGDEAADTTKEPTMTPTKPTMHRDGTITYWSVYGQAWVRRASSVPDREFAAMGDDERARVQRHIAR